LATITIVAMVTASAQPEAVHPPCAREFLPRIVALLVTKDDEHIMQEWLDYNAPSFHAVVVFDSSKGYETQRIVSAYVNRCGANITYVREDLLPEPLLAYSDHAVRYHPLRILRHTYGVGRWVMVAHSDEFYYHEPELVARYVDTQIATGSWEECNVVVWGALHVLPHPSEYESFVARPQPLAQSRFQHFWMMYGSKRNGLPWSERRLFKDHGFDYVRNANYAMGVIPGGKKLTNGYRKCSNSGFWPAYLHYKVVTPDPSKYTAEGLHRGHWVGPGGPRVGLNSSLTSAQDFFAFDDNIVRHLYGVKRDFHHVGRFDGCLTGSAHPAWVNRTDTGWSALEALRVSRVWPVTHSGSSGKECARNATGARPGQTYRRQS